MTYVNVTTSFEVYFSTPSDDANKTDGFIILADCQIVEAFIHHLWTLLDNQNVIFLDYFICQHLQKSANLFHLEAFHLKVYLSSYDYLFYR